jgi:hypothetical protein
VFVLHAADGTPLCITDSFEEATRDAGQPARAGARH